MKSLPAFWLEPVAKLFDDVAVCCCDCLLLSVLLGLYTGATTLLAGATLSGCDSENDDLPPGGACTLVVLRSVMKLPLQFAKPQVDKRQVHQRKVQLLAQCLLALDDQKKSALLHERTSLPSVQRCNAHKLVCFSWLNCTFERSNCNHACATICTLRECNEAANAQHCNDMHQAIRQQYMQCQLHTHNCVHTTSDAGCSAFESVLN
jgi:hypothetical protein